MIAELHCHTKSSKVPYFPKFYDSVVTVEQLLNKCLELGITILAITDHNTMSGYRKAKRLIRRQKLPIILIPACEISTKEGHILAYGITKLIPKGLTCQETIERIHKQKGIAIAAHPYNFFSSLHKKIYKYDIDGVESFNSTSSKWANGRAKRAAEKLGLPEIAGSDAHTIAGVGKGRQLFREPVSNWRKAIRAILRKETDVEEEKQNRLALVSDHVRENLMILALEKIEFADIPA